MQNEDSNSKLQIRYLAVTWLIMIPLMYFASQGVFWFQSISSNNSLHYVYGALGTASESVETTAIAVLIFGIIFTLISLRIRSVAAVGKEGKVFVLLAILALMSCVWSQFAITSLKCSLCLVGNILFAFYLWKRFTLERLLALLLMLGWVCLVFSIALSLLFPQYGIDQAVGSVGAWRGMYVHKNSCAAMTCILLSVAFYTRTRTTAAKIMRILYIGLSVFLIVMTQSRTGWILLMCLLAYVAAAKSIPVIKWKDKALLILIGSIALPLLITGGMFSWEKILYLLGKDPTLTGRTEIWQIIGPSVMKHYLLGYGYMGFWKGFQGESANISLASGWAVTSAHNGFLETWLELGSVGLIMVLYSLAKAFRDAAVCIKGGRDPFLQWCLCVILLNVVINVDLESFMLPNNLIWITYILACFGLSRGAKRIRWHQNHE